MSSFALSDWRLSKKIKEKFGISCSSRDQVRVDADQISCVYVFHNTLLQSL